MSKRVAIILVNWNSFTLTGNCICSLGDLSYPDFDIVVVDNGSEDLSGNALKKAHPHIHLIPAGSNLGFSGGNNLGIKYAMEQGFEYVLLLNNDTFSEKAFLGILVDYMDKHATVGAVQPLIYFEHNRSLVWNAGSYFNQWLGKSYVANYNRTINLEKTLMKEVDWITGCAFFTRLAVLKQTGLLAENLFMYYEDVDLSFRIRNAGHKLVLLPGSVIYHIAGMSNKKKIKDKEGYVNPVVHYLNTRNRIWLLKKYTPFFCVPSMILFTGFYFTGVILYFIARRRFQKLRSVLKGIRDGFRSSIKYS